MTSNYCHPGGLDPRCPLCRRARNDPRFAAAMAAVPAAGTAGPAGTKKTQKKTPAATETKRPLPCLHLGSPTPPPNGKPTAKAWKKCDHPDQPLGPAVCSCAGCGPRCRGYEPDEPLAG